MLAFDPKTILAASMLGTPKPKPLHNSPSALADPFADFIGPLSASQRDMQARAANTSAGSLPSLSHTATTAPILAPAPVSASPSPGAPTANASPAALLSFPYFPLYTLDDNDGTVMFPGAN